VTSFQFPVSGELETRHWQLATGNSVVNYRQLPSGLRLFRSQH
jgi:hypothetical protein